VTEIIRAGEKAAALNRRLVAMGFGRLAAAAAVDVHELLEKIADEMRQSPDKPIRVDLELTAEASITQGDEEQLHTALLHLAQTLRDAMPYGGAMTIATRKVTLEPVDCQDRPVPIPPGDYLELTVADRSAVPVPAAVPAGPQHEAAELNLAGVFAAIRAHGGSIELNTPEGQGLACLLLLPLAAQG
jgi:two-component system CheB/CheR fusion protein